MKTFTTVSLLTAVSAAKTIAVTAGANLKLAFVPDSVTAAKGDVLMFTIFPQHAVALGTTSAPCTAASTDVYSGLNMGSSDMTFAVTVNSTGPLEFFCTQVGHCQGGMVMVVNPPSASTIKTVAAAAVKTTTTPPKSVGGGIINGKAPSSSGGSSGGSSSSSAAPSSTPVGGGGGGIYGGGGAPPPATTGKKGDGNALKVGATGLITAVAGVALAMVAL